MTSEVRGDYDLVIVGAGLTGLSLACWLMQLAKETGASLPSVCLIDPRTAYTNDRTWCFWDLEPHPFRHLITHRWSHWQVSYEGKTACQAAESLDYVMLPSDELYRHATGQIGNTPGFDLCLCTTVDSIEQTPEGKVVMADDGARRAKAVIDTRPPAEHQLQADNACWQLFAGIEIACPNHGFDLSTARLMDFQPGHTYPSFVYLLPLSDERLLVEWTTFKPQQRPVDDLRANLESWLARQELTQYRALRSEAGALPMMAVTPDTDTSGVVRAGVGAGWMRAATGYHFATCQRGCAELARQILAARHSGDWDIRNPAVRPAWLDWMDQVFLKAMARHPGNAPGWFTAMFAGTSPGQMARFMNDQPRLRDALAIASALPPGPFLRAAMPW